MAKRIQGLADLDRRIRRITSQIKRHAVNGSLAAASKPMQKTAARMAPRGKTGAFREAMKIGKSRVIRRYKGGLYHLAVIGPSDKVIVDSPYNPKFKHRPARIAHLIEFGHRARDGSMTKPQPFMRPAWDRHAKQSERIFEKDLTKRIDAAVKKNRAKLAAL